MRFADLLRFAWQVLGGYRARTALILLAMGIGVAAVVAVSSIGEGARLYVVNQFGSLGTNLIIVLPGRSETSGGMPGVLMGKMPRDLTIDDALALKRSASVLRLAPLIVEQLMEFLVRLNEEEGVAILLVDQNAVLAFSLCERSYVLETGRIAVEGPSSELRDRPEVRSAYLGGGSGPR